MINLSDFQKFLHFRKSPVLLIVHSNYFQQIGGIEKETYLLLKRLVRNLNQEVLVFFYDIHKERFFLQRINKVKCITYGVIGDDSEEILKEICRITEIKLCVIQHLLNHSLNYIKYLKRFRTILFVHDFFYIYPYPYLSASEGYNYMDFIDLEALNTQRNKVFFKDINQLEGFVFDISAWGRKVLNVFKNVDLVIYNSEFTKREYEKSIPGLSVLNSVISYPKFWNSSK
jgi:hypothetical protein